jgi:maltose-binding protein MalE
MQPINFGLVYLEKDPRTQQPSACICMKPSGVNNYAGVPANQLISAQCMNFLQLDAELRRLHAELDELRAQARKKFYKAEAVVGAGAGS